MIAAQLLPMSPQTPVKKVLQLEATENDFGKYKKKWDLLEVYELDFDTEKRNPSTDILIRKGHNIEN